MSMNIVKFEVDSILTLKKKHPCGGFDFKVARCGSDVRIVCIGCGRDLTIPRITLEKAIRAVDGQKV